MSGWDELHRLTALAREKLLAAAPDEATAREGEAYLIRVVTGSLSDNFLGHLFLQQGLTRALPIKGGPNPDYLLCHAAVSHSQTYVLRGKLNGSERVGVGLYAFGKNGEALERGYAAFERDNVGPSGEFSLTLSSAAQGKDTLTLTPECRVLLIRTLHRDPEKTPAALALAGQEEKRDLPLSGGDHDAGLVAAGQMTLRNVEQFLGWSQQCSAHPNTLFTAPDHMAAAVQGDPDTEYLLGYYQLAHQQWLEISLPDGLQGYWSLHAYNHWGEPLPDAGIHNLNAQPDTDGRIHISLGPTLPAGATNLVDTLQRQRGILIFRAIAPHGRDALAPRELPKARVCGPNTG